MTGSGLIFSLNLYLVELPKALSFIKETAASGIAGYTKEVFLAIKRFYSNFSHSRRITLVQWLGKTTPNFVGG